MRNRIYLFSLIILSLFTLESCKDPKNEDVSNSNFDRQSLLINMGNNIIIPSFKNLKTATDKLDSAVTDFTTDPTSVKLINLQAIFKDAYRSWEPCSPFCSPYGFGIDDQKFLGLNVNSFPTETSTINSNITSGSYNLDALSNRPAKGLPGIEYLLFGTGPDNAAILATFTSASDAAGRKKYLNDISADIKTKVTSVYNSWLPDGGNYLNTFIQSTGTDVSSSTSKLVNAIDQDLDALKYYKIALPIGIISATLPQQTARPDQVEAYYSGISVELAAIQLQAAENIYLGKSALGDGVGFDDYLIQINAQKSTGGPLNDAIKSQFDAAELKLLAIPDPLSQTITNDMQTVKTGYTELQKLLVLFKKDMSSSLGILITYPDADGD